MATVAIAQMSNNLQIPSPPTNKTLISLCSKFSNILNDCMKNQDLGSPRSELEQFSINQTNNSFYEILSCFISMDYSIKSHCHDHILMV